MENRYERFTALITSIEKRIERIKSLQMKEFGLKGNQVQCIYYLRKHQEGLTPSEICKLCREDKAAISRTIKYLEERGLVFIREIENKKYRNPIKLTEKGADLGASIERIIEDKLQSASLGIKESEREMLYIMLGKINDNLNNICKSEGDSND